MSEWISVKKRLPEPNRKVDVWMHIYASPRSFGMSDSFRVMDAWREDGKWFHYDSAARDAANYKAELVGDYVTHWMSTPEPPK